MASNSQANLESINLLFVGSIRTIWKVQNLQIYSTWSLDVILLFCIYNNSRSFIFYYSITISKNH